MRYAPLVLALALWGCDSNDPDPPTPVLFQGVEVEARGGATLTPDGSTLVVSGVGASGADGLQVRGNLASLDLETEPIRIPEGGSFGIRVEDAFGDVLSGFQNVDRPGDAGHDFEFEFADRLGIEAVRVTYRFRDRVAFEIPSLPLGEPKRGLRKASAGSGSGDSGSVHTVRENGRYIVVSDSGKKTGCPGFIVTPPPPFDLDVPEGVCADWVEVAPLSTLPAPTEAIGAVAVVGAGLGSFTVTTLSAEE